MVMRRPGPGMPNLAAAWLTGPGWPPAPVPAARPPAQGRPMQSGEGDRIS
jgi:hypothetical protein